jgi:hypothetical protein
LGGRVTESLARRRFMALSAALVGAQTAASLPLAAQEKKKQESNKKFIDCTVKGAKGRWSYTCLGGRECRLESQPAARRAPGADYLVKPMERGWFTITVRADSVRPEVSFPEFGTVPASAPTSGPGELHYLLSVDGREVWTPDARNSASAFWADSLRKQGPAILAAMRAGKLFQATISSDTMKPLFAMDFPLDGFAEALVEGEAANAKVRAQLDATTECRPTGVGAIPCFFTTAACGAVGLPDDCFELTMLRRVRDRYLSASAEGRAEIALYYAAAPAILDALHRRPDAYLTLLRLYAFVIVPCAFLARLGMAAAAHRLYRHAFRRLSAISATPAASRMSNDGTSAV